MSDDMCHCDWCGSDNWFEWELDNGKCKMCIVNTCHHHNQDTVSYEINYSPKTIDFHHVCLDCELSWTMTYKLENGKRSKLTHEDVNTDDIYQDVKV